MTAEILTVGTEILLGNILNANAAFLSQSLAGLGIGVYCHTSVGDNHERLKTALSAAFDRADIVITTGGLGPTQDDITKSVCAEYFGLELATHEESRRRIHKRFEGRTLPTCVERNALVPVGAEVFPNDNGSAPGICIERGGKTLIMLPGPPHEMQPMFTDYAAAYLRKKTGNVFISRTLKIVGIGETAVEEALLDLIAAQSNPTIAPYAKVGEVHIRLTASAPDEAAAQAKIAPIAEEIYTRLSPRIYGEDNESLAEILVNLLKSNNYSITTAESCTGGMVAASLISVPGCSAVLNESFITYSNESKTNRLNIPADLIKTHGAVSAETAAAMAEGAAQAANADVAISVTGIAGPDGGTPTMPVGSVYIGIYIKGEPIQTARFNTVGNRQEVRTRSTILALDFARRCIQLLPNTQKLKIAKAELSDLPQILALQKQAYQSEAALIGDYAIPPLTQTLDGITDDFNKGTILKAVKNGEIIGSVRAYTAENTVYIGKIIVNPTHQNQGIGTKLLLAIENTCPAERYELFTSAISAKNLHIYTKNGYKEFKREPLNEKVDFVFLEKYRGQSC